MPSRSRRLHDLVGDRVGLLLLPIVGRAELDSLGTASVVVLQAELSKDGLVANANLRAWVKDTVRATRPVLSMTENPPLFRLAFVLKVAQFGPLRRSLYGIARPERKYRRP